MPGSIISGIFAGKAAKTQAKAAGKAGDTQLQMFERSVELSEPWRAGGESALGALQYELGLGELPTFGSTTSFGVGDQSFGTREGAETFQNTLQGGDAGGQWTTVPNERDGGFKEIWAPGTSAGGAPDITETTTGGFPYAGFEQTPGYQFQLDEGQKAINRSLAARGKVLSGPAVKEGLRFSQGLADQTYVNHLKRLANMAGLGADVAGQQGAFGIQAGQGIASSQIQAGNARASGYAATGQALSSPFNIFAKAVGAGAFGGF